MIDLRLGDCLSLMRGMAAESVHCCVTSPPYYGVNLGLDKCHTLC